MFFSVTVLSISVWLIPAVVLPSSNTLMIYPSSLGRDGRGISAHPLNHRIYSFWWAFGKTDSGLQLKLESSSLVSVRLASRISIDESWIACGNQMAFRNSCIIPQSKVFRNLTKHASAEEQQLSADMAMTLGMELCWWLLWYCSWHLTATLLTAVSIFCIWNPQF